MGKRTCFPVVIYDTFGVRLLITMLHVMTTCVSSLYFFQARALRVSFVGELGWELHCPSESCVPVYRAIMEAEAEGGMRAVNGGYRAMVRCYCRVCLT